MFPRPVKMVSFMELINGSTFSLILGVTVDTAVFIASGRLLNKVCSIGIKLPKKKVLALSTSSPIFLATALPSPTERLPNKFLAEAFIIAKAPLKVLPASSAVVPATPKFSCIAWIALYTSDKLSILYLTPVSC